MHVDGVGHFEMPQPAPPSVAPMTASGADAEVFAASVAAPPSFGDASWPTS
jgi:hypothetical protein